MCDRISDLLTFLVQAGAWVSGKLDVYGSGLEGPVSPVGLEWGYSICSRIAPSFV